MSRSMRKQPNLMKNGPSETIVRRLGRPCDFRSSLPLAASHARPVKYEAEWKRPGTREIAARPLPENLLSIGVVRRRQVLLALAHLDDLHPHVRILKSSSFVFAPLKLA